MSKGAVEEFLEMRKEAGPWDQFPQHFSSAAAGGLAAAGVGVGIAGIGMAASKILDAATKSHDFHAMLDANEDLREHHDTDPKRFNMLFSTLRTMNPEFSKDPLVAGAFVRQMIGSPNGIGGIASEALKHRGDFDSSIMEHGVAFGREGAKAGLTESFKHRSPEEMLSQQKPTMDYASKLKREEAMPGHEQREEHHQKNIQEKRRSESAQRKFQGALSRMPEYTRKTRGSDNEERIEKTHKKSW